MQVCERFCRELSRLCEYLDGVLPEHWASFSMFLARPMVHRHAQLWGMYVLIGHGLSAL